MMPEHNRVFSEVPDTAVDWRPGADAGEKASGCPWHDCRMLLRQVGLRPTRQRLLLGWILFSKGDRHLTAEMLHDEAMKARIPVSLATVYNTLHQFTEAGLLREIGIAGAKAFFDTNPSAHHHFLVEGEEVLMDIPEAGDLVVDRVPQAPEGFEIARIDVVVRLRRTEAGST
jgi:Fur family iron response transcriptional regulator